MPQEIKPSLEVFMSGAGGVSLDFYRNHFGQYEDFMLDFMYKGKEIAMGNVGQYPEEELWWRFWFNEDSGTSHCQFNLAMQQLQRKFSPAELRSLLRNHPGSSSEDQLRRTTRSATQDMVNLQTLPGSQEQDYTGRLNST
eukprot:5614169-Amphidinium_carterae.2